MNYEKLARLNAIRRKHGFGDWHFPQSWRDLPPPDQGKLGIGVHIPDKLWQRHDTKNDAGDDGDGLTPSRPE